MANGYKKFFKSKNFRLKLLNFLRFIPDKTMLKIEYRIKFHKKLNINNPQTFNEKLQWLKIYYNRSVLHTQLVDKYRVRKFISQTIGDEFLFPLIGVWERVDDIDLSLLPDQFVLKTNHDSGGIWICKNKASFNKFTHKMILLVIIIDYNYQNMYKNN